MKKQKLTAVAITLIMAILPMAMVANTEPPTRVENNITYAPIRQTAYHFGATVDWDNTMRAAIITGRDDAVHTVIIEETGGFIENGVSWIPAEFITNELIPLLTAEAIEPTHEPIEATDAANWSAERFADVREPAFSTDLPHGAIALNYTEYISNNLGARSAFTYRELETAVWIVEELLAMGHNWDNIEVQEFTYWEVQDLGISLDFGIEIDIFPLNWEFVTSPMILGVNREYQLRTDRTSQNVILTIPGQSERKIIVGAHYDSPPYASAGDNAAGVAALLESAQRMLELEHYYTIVYVFFGAEEVGFIGALYYLEMLSQNQHNNIELMINVDCLIDGPYLIYGAGVAPTIDNELIAHISLAILESQMDILTMQFEMIMADFEGTGVDPATVLPFYSLESFSEFVLHDIASMPPALLFMQATMLGLVEPVVDSVSRQVNDIATGLTAAHDFELISIPEAINVPSDNLPFLFAGHRVVTIMGMERAENLDGELAAQLLQRESIHPDMGFGDFVFTVFHTPLDEFATIESLWPGMMNANLEAFGLFIEAILTGRFS